MADTTAVTSTGEASSKRRIGNVMAAFMLTVSGTVDLVQFLVNFVPGLGQVVSFLISGFMLFSFGIWFALLGVNYFQGRKAGIKLAATFGGVIAELVPIVSALPALSVSVAVMIVASRLEDAAAGAVPKVNTRPRAALRLRPQSLRSTARTNPTGPQPVGGRPTAPKNRTPLQEPANDTSPSENQEKPARATSGVPGLPLRFGTRKVPMAADNDNAQNARNRAA